MPQQITSVLDRLQAATRQLSLAQRVFSVLLAVLVLVAVVALVQTTSKPTMAPLFTNLAPADASAVVEQLDASGIPYELTAGGATIMVPESQLYDTRLAVASAGLPSDSGVGYALLDEMSMTSSEFQQQVTYQRALEGELATTVAAMDGVETASVKLALPQETVFVSEQQAPTASVFVSTVPGSALGTTNVQAIMNLVSASIEGMKPEDVAVIDSTGVVLSSVGADAATLVQASETAAYEQRVATGVQEMLDRVVGPGNAVVSISAELDYDTRATTSETFTSDPDALPLSESSTVEEFTGGAGTEAGVLGPDNIAVPSGTEAGEYRNESTVRNNAVNKVTEVTEMAPGTVRRQSVSVVANQEAAAAIDLADLEEMVAAAAGIDQERGDVLAVTRMAFDSTAADEAAAALEEAEVAQRAAENRSFYMEAAKWGGLALVVIISIIIAFVSSRRRRKDQRIALSLEAVEELEARANAAIEARTQALIGQASAEASHDALALEAAPVPDMDTVTAVIREEISAFAEQQPAEVAEVLRGWISTERR
ncbi:MAG: flagellar basal-body MS-ring/collar protein FliF [Actinomycetes bacterium]